MSSRSIILLDLFKIDSLRHWQEINYLIQLKILYLNKYLPIPIPRTMRYFEYNSYPRLNRDLRNQQSLQGCMPVAPWRKKKIVQFLLQQQRTIIEELGNQIQVISCLTKGFDVLCRFLEPTQNSLKQAAQAAMAYLQKAINHVMWMAVIIQNNMMLLRSVNILESLQGDLFTADQSIKQKL